MHQATNSISTTPDYIQGVEKGQPVLVPRSSLVDGAGNSLLVGISNPVLPRGRAGISGAAPVNRHCAFILPHNFVAWKVRLHNAHTSAVTYKAALTTQSAIGDSTYNDKVWQTALFSGVDSVSVPAGIGSVAEHTFGYIDSDVMTHESAVYPGGGTIVALRTYVNIANNTRFDTDEIGAQSLATTGFFRSFNNVADAVADPTSYVSVQSNPSMPPASLITYTAEQVTRIGLFGSSTTQGFGDEVSLGWAWRSQISSAGNKPRIYANYSHNGATTSSNLRRFFGLIGPAFNVNYAVFNAYSSNDSDGNLASSIPRYKSQCLQFISACRLAGIKPVLQTWQHPIGFSGQSYINALAINSFVRTLQGSGLCLVLDIGALLCDESATVGTWKVPGDTTDGVHPNSQGQVKIAALANALFV